jgi:hypothetical protein
VRVGKGRIVRQATKPYSACFLQQIGDAELEQELGITNTLHRLKLRLAVQEILTVTTNTKSQHRTVRGGVWMVVGVVMSVCQMFNGS